MEDEHEGERGHEGTSVAGPVAPEATDPGRIDSDRIDSGRIDSGRVDQHLEIRAALDGVEAALDEVAAALLRMA